MNSIKYPGEPGTSVYYPEGHSSGFGGQDIYFPLYPQTQKKSRKHYVFSQTRGSKKLSLRLLRPELPASF